MGRGFETNGFETHDEIVCSHSRRKRQPCRKIACKHHVCHVKSSQSGTEFYVKNLKKEGACYEKESVDRGRIEKIP